MKQNKKNTLGATYPAWFVAPGAFVYALFWVVPVGISLVLSFTDWNLRRMFEPEFYGIGNYQEVLTDPVFKKALINTLIYAFSSSIGKIVVGLALALVLSKQFFGNNVFRTVFYMPCVLSSTVVGVLFSSILANGGMLNNVLGIFGLDFLQRDWLGSYGTAMAWIVSTDIWMWAGFNMFIFISGLQAIPNDYYEYASTEGVSAWHQFLYITIPLLAPSITVNVTLNISGGLKVFDIVYVLTNGGPGDDTQVLATYVFRAFGVGYLGESAAASVLLSIVVVVIAFTFNKILTDREIEA